MGKAAHRATMVEMSEYMENEREKAEERMRVFVESQRKIWTPTSVFDKCCVKWLADGRDMSCNISRYVVRSGCSGNGICGRAHPRITLDWQTNNDNDNDNNNNGVGIATLSHELDPFLAYFDALCQEGLASKVTTVATKNDNDDTKVQYRLVGFLQTHITRLESKASFGSHLIQVSAKALKASGRAQSAQMEQEEVERDAKRLKTMSQVDLVLLEMALEMCYNHGLHEYLDLVEISWLRVTCKTTAKIAAKMAKIQMSQVRLCYSVLVDGFVRFKWPNRTILLENSDEGCINLPRHETIQDRFGRDPGGSIQQEYYKIQASHLPLCMMSPLGAFVPPSSNSMTKGKEEEEEEVYFSWKSPFLNLESHPSVLQVKEGDDEFAFDYRGHMIRVYLYHPSISVSSSTKYFFEWGESNLLEVARYRIRNTYGGFQEGVHNVPNKFTYEVVTSAEEEQKEMSSPWIQYSGKFRIQEISFTFGDLLGVYVRQKLPKEKSIFASIKQKRPVKRSEKEYVKALAKEVREAPGNGAWAFEGMKGW